MGKRIEIQGHEAYTFGIDIDHTWSPRTNVLSSSHLSGSRQRDVLRDLLCVVQIITQPLHLLLNHPYRVLTDCQTNGELTGAISEVVNEFDGLVWVALGFPFAGKFTHKDTGQRGVRVGGVGGNDDNRVRSSGVETTEFEKGDLTHGGWFEVQLKRADQECTLMFHAGSNSRENTSVTPSRAVMKLAISSE